MSTLVGVEPTVSDPDPADQLLFSISAGNSGGAFAIAQCRGQLRVAAEVLDWIVGPRQYNLTVTVTDDGTPPLNASAVTTVNLVRVCVAKTERVSRSEQRLRSCAYRWQN